MEDLNSAITARAATHIGGKAEAHASSIRMDGRMPSNGREIVIER